MVGEEISRLLFSPVGYNIHMQLIECPWDNSLRGWEIFVPGQGKIIVTAAWVADRGFTELSDVDTVKRQVRID